MVSKNYLILVILILIMVFCQYTVSFNGNIYSCDNGYAVKYETKTEDTYKLTSSPYKLFYGEWEVTEIVSKHMRIGGDNGYEKIVGTKIYYDEFLYKNSYKLGLEVKNPIYAISIIPIKDNSYNQFFTNQIGIETLLPNANYFVFVQVVGLMNENNQFEYGRDYEYIGREFLIKDNDTMFMFDYNCIYKLNRVSNIYDEDIDITYQERM